MKIKYIITSILFCVFVCVGIHCTKVNKEKNLNMSGDRLNHSIELQKAFKKWRNPERGKKNPHDMTNPFWVYAVKKPQSGYNTNQEFGGPDSFDKGPCWSFERFGQTKTELKDGTVIYIAGEHEDGYDPDFYIYNDVTVVAPDGKVKIYGYSEKVFPATDFHTASSIGNEIVIIGCLGYPDERENGLTPVYILELDTMSIRSQATTNDPGWISSHTAVVNEDKSKIVITDIQRWTEKSDLRESFETWALDIGSWEWTLIERKNWSQYEFTREDGGLIELFNRRHSIDMEKMKLPELSYDDVYEDMDEETLRVMEEFHKEIKEEQKRIVKTTDKKVLESLYDVSVPFKKLVRPEIEYEENDEEWETKNEELDKIFPYNHHLIEVEGITIRFIEDSHEVTARVEGLLSEEVMTTILNEVSAKLEKVEGGKFKWKKLER